MTLAIAQKLTTSSSPGLRARARVLANKYLLAASKAKKTNSTKLKGDRMMVKETYLLQGKKVHLYQVILLALASYRFPVDDIVPILKGGTISTQYSNRPVDVSNIDIQIMKTGGVGSGKTRLRSLTGNVDFWKLFYRKNMTHVLGLGVFMIQTLNKLSGLKKAAARIWKEPIESISFRLRGSHVAKPRKITLISVDMHIKTSSGKKNQIPVFDMVLGDARSPKMLHKKDVITLKTGGKTLYQYSWPWISRDFEGMVKDKDPKAMVKREKRLGRWMEGLIRTPRQRDLNKTKVFKDIGTLGALPYTHLQTGHIRRAIMRYSDTVRTRAMLTRMLEA